VCLDVAQSFVQLKYVSPKNKKCCPQHEYKHTEGIPHIMSEPALEKWVEKWFTLTNILDVPVEPGIDKYQGGRS
jgi:hypothetical protein